MAVAGREAREARRAPAPAPPPPPRRRAAVVGRGARRLDARRRRRGERELRDLADHRFGEVVGGGQLATMRDGRSGVGEPLPGARGEVRVDECELGAQHVVRRHGRDHAVQCPHDVLIGSPCRSLYRGTVHLGYVPARCPSVHDHPDSQPVSSIASQTVLTVVELASSQTFSRRDIVPPTGDPRSAAGPLSATGPAARRRPPAAARTAVG